MWIRSCALAGVFLAPVAVAGPLEIEVDPSRTAQEIQGWGGSNSWFTDDYLDYTEETRRAFVDFLWADDGLGLNIHRGRVIRVGPDPTTGGPIDWKHEKLIEQAKFLKYVQDLHDPIIFLSSWTPPPRMKTVDSNRGGKLRPDAYDDFADYLVEYITGMEERFGVEIDVLSPQNEPDEEKPWSSCVWTGQEMAAFVGEHLGPAFEEHGIETKILVGEWTSWDDAFPNAVLENAEAAKHVDLVGGHLYHNSHDKPKVFEEAVAADIPVWQTEFYLGNYRFPKGEAIDEHERTLWLGQIMHDSLVHSQVNAYLFWWLLSPEAKGPQGLLSSPMNFDERDKSQPLTEWVVTPRAYGFGQFSRFVRPGATRLELADDQPAEGVFVSAFHHEGDGQMSIVIVNRSQASHELALSLPAGFDGELEVVRTSRDEQMATVREADVTIRAKSITTIVARQTDR
jgi:glucuronoarabinoxylan endo-1,4-beta-xylanase